MRSPDTPLAALEHASAWLLLRILGVLAAYLLLRLVRWPLALVLAVVGGALRRLDHYALALAAPVGVCHA